MMQLSQIKFETYIWRKPGTRAVNLVEVVSIHPEWRQIGVVHHGGQFALVPPSELHPKPQPIAPRLAGRGV